MASKTKKKSGAAAGKARKPAPKTHAVKKAVARPAAATPPKPVDIDPGWAWDDRLPFVQGKRIGNLIYVSGQVSLDSEGKVVGEGDIKAQTRQALENLRTVLAAAGARLNNIVKLNSYITDASLYHDFSEARTEIFGSHRPASTLVVVAALAFPGLLVEMEAVALKA
jgi:2-iminobutanoate/2-iminopropanoate deaminase